MNFQHENTLSRKMENTIRQRVNQIRDEQKHSLAATARTRIMGRPLVDMLERVVRNNNIMQGYQVTDDFDDRRVSSSSSSSEDASVTPCFEALYEDVVLKSKIPQLIATTGGKLIAWNDSFLQISNLTEPQISSSMTLFHIIQPHFFPKLFEFFTLTLRRRTNQHRRTSSSSRKRTRSLASSTTTNHSTEKERYNTTSSRDDTDAEALFGEDDNSEAFYAVSFPCETTHMNPNGRILSPTGIATKTTNSSSNSNMTDALVITLILMNDLDPNKQCYHCIISDRGVDNTNESHTTDERNTSSNRRKKSPGHTSATTFGEIRLLDVTVLTNLLCIE